MTSTNGAALLILLVATGCPQSGDGGPPIPGADLDAVVGARGAAVAAADLQPCGYEITNDSTFAGLPPIHEHEIVRITYDAAGLNRLEEGVDDRNGFAFRYTTEYTEMGNQAYFKAEFVDLPMLQFWYVYDSFGRMVRSATDQDGDDREDLVATYVYGDDGRRTIAHLAGRVTYDRTYHYDDDGRVIQLDRDDGPDGVIDEVTTFQYDDIARVTTMLVTDRDQRVTGTGTTSYDGDNHKLVSTDSHFFFDPPGSYTTTTRYTYAAGRLVSDTTTTTMSDAGGAVYSTDIDRLDWHYEHCP